MASLEQNREKFGQSAENILNIYNKLWQFRVIYDKTQTIFRLFMANLGQIWQYSCNLLQNCVDLCPHWNIEQLLLFYY